MKRVLVCFGTRPEAIKMAVLVKKLQKENFDVKVCVTAQHREMLDQVLVFFDITPDYDLNIMSPNQTLNIISSKMFEGMDKIYNDFNPDLVLVHGDTTTSTICAMSAFHRQIKVGHVEAGLRTYNKLSPFPEEMNRQLTGQIADYHFAPTENSKKNLVKEGISQENILVTGNTVIDALLESKGIVNQIENKEIIELSNKVDITKKIILVTGHRRENHGEGFINICEALNEIAKNNPEVQIVYPVHLNPNVKKPVNEILGNTANILLIDPLSYPSFVWLMDKCYLILTDSGGVQEEAPSLGKPVLVMRNNTERPEAVEAGTVILVGTNKNKIVTETEKLIQNKTYYKSMSNLHNPYGDGKACEKIVEYIKLV